MGVYEEVKPVFDGYGIPDYIWYPIMMMESGGNPKAQANNSKETSVGLFQINLKAHPEYRGLNLKDPKVNANIAGRDFILPAFRKVQDVSDKPTQTAYVWRYGIRPKWTTEKENAIKDKTFNFLTSGKSNTDNVSRETITESIDTELPSFSGKGATWFDIAWYERLGMVWLMFFILIVAVFIVFRPSTDKLENAIVSAVGAIKGGSSNV